MYRTEVSTSSLNLEESEECQGLLRGAAPVTPRYPNSATQLLVLPFACMLVVLWPFGFCGTLCSRGPAACSSEPLCEGLQ